jgi:hypothetical protein
MLLSYVGSSQPYLDLARTAAARANSLAGRKQPDLARRPDSHVQTPDVAANPCTEAQGVAHALGCGESGKSGVGNPVDDDP